MTNYKTQQDKIESKFNQAQATHDRLDVLFQLLHEHNLSGKFREAHKVLYRVLAEASSVLTQDEYETCKESIDDCSGFASKVNQRSVLDDFLEAEKTLRMNLQGHGMMIKEKSHDQGDTLGAP
jgi:cell fate (sporulation/competence/biofilm development) regulator YlbF (YheA/YmcA/DUF963 family)